MHRTRPIRLILCVLLVGCSGGASSTADESGSGADLPSVSGTKTAAYEISLLNSPEGTKISNRPSAPFGVFVSSFIAQGGAFLRSATATTGIDAQMKLLEGQINVETSETFALLKEFGAILQTDIVDALNRSEDRLKTLDTYLSSLKNITELVQRKSNELDSVRDKLEDEKKELNRRIRDLEKTIKRAIDEQNYEQAGVDQEELTSLKSEIASLETEIEQNKDIVDRYEKLIDIAKERYDALSVNRRIVLSGLKVVEVPGIDDLEILDANARIKKSESPFNVGPDELRLGTKE